MKYAYLGQIGSWSHAAALKITSENNIAGYASFDLIAQALTSNEVDAAIVPVRNSLTGEVKASDPVMKLDQARVTRTLSLKIEHCLASNDPVELEDLKRFQGQIFSHPQGFLQCKAFLNTHVPCAERLDGGDTSTSISKVMAISDLALAIGSQTAILTHGAHLIAADINDDPNNETIFNEVVLDPC
jgi:chorismate mutase/prephenate dehydratase